MPKLSESAECQSVHFCRGLRWELPFAHSKMAWLWKTNNSCMAFQAVVPLLKTTTTTTKHPESKPHMHPKLAVQKCLPVVLTIRNAFKTSHLGIFVANKQVGWSSVTVFMGLLMCYGKCLNPKSLVIVHWWQTYSAICVGYIIFFFCVVPKTTFVYVETRVSVDSVNFESWERRTPNVWESGLFLMICCVTEFKLLSEVIAYIY